MTLLVTARLGLPILESSVESVPGADVVVEQQTATNDGARDLTVWVADADLAAFEEALDADETVARWTLVARTDARKLYRVRLTSEAATCVDCDGWADGEAVFRSWHRTPHGWAGDMVIPDRSVLRTLASRCESNGVAFDLLRVVDVERLQEVQQFGLTELQADALRMAFDRGFFSVPRQLNLEELAAPLDVSYQALSERLRRGLNTLIEHTIAEQRDDMLPMRSGWASSTRVSTRDIGLGGAVPSER